VPPHPNLLAQPFGPTFCKGYGLYIISRWLWKEIPVDREDIPDRVALRQMAGQKLGESAGGPGRLLSICGPPYGPVMGGMVVVPL